MGEFHRYGQASWIFIPKGVTPERWQLERLECGLGSPPESVRFPAFPFSHRRGKGDAGVKEKPQALSLPREATIRV